LALLLEKPTKEAGCGARVPPLLYQNVQNLTLLIYCSIQISEFSINANEDFIDEPLITGGTRSLA
jgi:hypothetical protein